MTTLYDNTQAVCALVCGHVGPAAVIGATDVASALGPLRPARKVGYIFLQGPQVQGQVGFEKAWKEEFLGRAGGRVFEWGVRFLLTWML